MILTIGPTRLSKSGSSKEFGAQQDAEILMLERVEKKSLIFSTDV